MAREGAIVLSNVTSPPERRMRCYLAAATDTMTRRNLILVHRGPDYERDFEEIAQKVNALDRKITIYQLSAGYRGGLPEGAWDLPTLTVALSATFGLKIMRGPILSNGYIDKLAQAKRVQERGLATPPILKFTPGMKLDPIMFGEFVVIKPMTLTSRGDGIQLFRRRRLQEMSLGDFPRSHPIHHDKEGYLIQKFIDTGEYPAWNRVMTFFGRPVYAVHGVLTVPRPPLAATDTELEAANIAIQAAERQREWRVEEDVLVTASAVGKAFPEIPFLAIDLLRDVKTRKLHFLECNPGGNTWHFSSSQPGGINLRHQLGEIDKNGPERALELGRQRMIAQFGAFDVIAAALVEKTHALAA